LISRVYACRAEVNTGKLLEKLAINPTIIFRTILDQSVKEAGITDESIVSIFGRKMNENGIRISRYFELFDRMTTKFSMT
jgi:hypothetical protein